MKDVIELLGGQRRHGQFPMVGARRAESVDHEPECAAVSLRGLVATELLGHLDDLHEKWNVVDFEVAAQGALFLGAIDKYRSVSSDPGARASEGVGREASVHQEIAESAVVCHAQRDHVEKVDKTFPGVGHLSGGGGDRFDLGTPRVEQCLDQFVLAGEAAIDGADADAGVLRDVCQRGVESLGSEHLASGVEDALEVGLGVGPKARL